MVRFEKAIPAYECRTILIVFIWHVNIGWVRKTTARP